MKRLLAFFCLLCTQNVGAQNYQCLQRGVKHYFTNANGYLRGIRIDSVNTLGPATIYYPFHTIRGNYFTLPVDSNGGSWLGKKVIALSDGTFFFDNIWHDTVVVKTQANVGDTWIFYNDTTRRYYLATLINKDTMTVSGVLDSIKTINITAFDDTGFVPADPVNNFKIVLSKNNGFVQVIDLFTFPYHMPDTTYFSHFDYYLDVLTGTVWSGSIAPTTAPITTANSVFSLISLINPPLSQIYDWNIGDAFENKVFTESVPSDGTYPYAYYFDSITNKTVLATGVQFDYRGWIGAQQFGSPWGTIYPSYNYPYAIANTTGSFVVSNDLVIDTTKMPEEHSTAFLEYYFPYDTAYCLQSCRYHFIRSFELPGEASPLQITYKTGIGLVYYDANVLGGAPPLILDTTQLYYRKSGIPCGNYVMPSPIFSEVTEVQKGAFQIFPDPASSFLTIVSPVPITKVVLMNIEGRILYAATDNSLRVEINVSNFQPGVYYAKINNTEMRMFIKE